ncbi:endonuclease domain-containing 1 protein-like [Onychostoma macrolepis]|uniref:endonuclease domain-containing 1 protein-like n=1 Tax=Onychostoma macrolepis TaxID=369639 RepID=UPI00272A95D9|nr:endonuclease domain-containing 1 protein-like [Onychostoma macrolepis]
MMLLLHVLMLSLLSGGLAKVVQDFESECRQFFANGKSPTRFSESQYKQICQTLDNDVYYATFYDTDNKIPVYSAYKFEGLMGCTRLNKWYIEPQLDSNNASPNMQLEKDVKKQGRGARQALNGDYEKSRFDKGHLAPVYQANSQICADATFTLTNAAPQNPSFNRGQWRVLEGNIAKELSDQCLPNKYSVYIVTGVVPGNNNINNRVKVPSHFWTAYCCLDNNNKCQISRGFIGENTNIAPKNKTIDDNNKGAHVACEGTVNIQIRGGRQALNGDSNRSGYHKDHLHQSSRQTHRQTSLSPMLLHKTVIL